MINAKHLSRKKFLGAVLVLSAISFGGLVIYPHLADAVNAPADHVSTQIQLTSATDSTLNTAPPETAITTPQGTFLDIKEIGVKMSLNSSVDDAVYAPFHAPTSDVLAAYGISSQYLISQRGDACAPSRAPLGLVIVTATQPGYPDEPTVLMPVDNRTVFKIGDKYYAYLRPQNDSCSGGALTHDTVESEEQAILSSFGSLQTDQ